MVLVLESCNLEESCAALDGTPKLLFELRDGLRDWLNMQPHLPKDPNNLPEFNRVACLISQSNYSGPNPIKPVYCDIPDHILEHFILGTKMSLEQAKHKLDMLYTMKRHAPEICLDRDPRSLSLAQLHKMMQIVYLPKLTPEKYMVSILRTTADDYGKFNAADCFKYMHMLGYIFANEAHSLGGIYIVDTAKATLGWITAYSPTLIKRCEAVATEGYAIRVKGLHFINASKITHQLITLTKSVLKPKLAARVHAHLPGTYESLYKLVPKSILPKDYGGDEMPMNELAEAWRQKADNWRDRFLEQDKILVDERLRPGPAVDTDNLFGISGSFRKLDVD